MAQERRKQPRYRPATEVGAVLHDTAGAYEAAAQLHNISEWGCALIVATPPRGGTPLYVDLFLGAAEPLRLSCRLAERIGLGETWQISLAFADIAADTDAALHASLNSDVFRQDAATPSSTHRQHWRVDQWAAYLTAQDLPVMARSKAALQALEVRPEQTPSSRELADLVNADPFLCLCLLREAESRRSSRLGHETSTPLAAVMQIGEQGVRDLLMSSPETDEERPGLAACEARAAAAGALAARWSTARADVSPDELVLGALLSEMGELLLWHFAPELPQAALEALCCGAARRSAEAQELRCGFKFKDLTLKCAEIWRLPPIIVQLMRGVDSTRANIARVCIDSTRHLASDRDNPALPDDLADAKLLIPGASLTWLVSCLGELGEEQRAQLVDQAEAALQRKRQTAVAGTL